MRPNVVVYVHDRTAGDKRARARELCSRLWTSRLGCLSVQVLQELYINVTQKVPRPIPHGAARQIVAGLGAWRTHRPAAEDVLAAIDLQQRHTVSFWDGMILRSAAALGCRILWTEDLNPGQEYDGVRALTPF